MPSGGIKFYLWLFCLCASLMGVQFVYSIQFSIGAPLFKNKLKLSQSTIAIILATAGPISGFIVQPIVGVWSDGCGSKWGRRRPFIFWGAVGCAIGMALIGGSVQIGSWLGDNDESADWHDHMVGIFCAVSGLWIMNLFVNTIQGPSRAVVLDIVPQDKQQDGNAMASGVMGLSAIIANVVGSLVFDTPEPYRNLFLFGIICVIGAIIPTMIVAKEKVHDQSIVVDPTDPTSKYTGVCGAFYKIYYAFRTIPRKMILVVVVYFLSWCAYSPFMIYLTSYFSDNIYKGSQKRRNHGIQMGMFGLAVFAAAQWLFSLVLAPLTRCFTVGGVYTVTQLLATGCYALFYWLADFGELTFVVGLAWGVMAVIALNFTTMNSVPFGLVRGITGNKNAGLYMGVLNAASVVAQTVTNCIAGAILKATRTHESGSQSSWGSESSSVIDSGENVAVAILMGAALSLIATFTAPFLRETKSEEEEEESPKSTEENQPLLVNAQSESYGTH